MVHTGMPEMCTWFAQGGVAKPSHTVSRVFIRCPPEASTQVPSNSRDRKIHFNLKNKADQKKIQKVNNDKKKKDNNEILIEKMFQSNT